ncbi:MAG: septum formation initiator family protein [Actinomycetaceae bacterium]|nr:septum formation initiator family protein [Actinomycetaceae bacterium]
MGQLLSVWAALRRHKYAVTLILFFLLLGFVDEDSFYVRYQRQVEIGRLRKEIDKYAELYVTETAQLEALRENPDAVEHVARERYFMKRPNEDVFVL